MALIYLDNAATSFPKPPCVLETAVHCISKDCGNAGRGGHPLAIASAERIYRCRESIASFFGAKDPSRVVFTMNATYAINFLLKGTLKAGDHVLISDLEHNAVLRPLEKLRQTLGISYDIFKTQPGYTARQICADILSRRRPNTRILICTHQSNICSFLLPLSAIGALCRQCGMLFFVDAAQSAGHLPIDMEHMQIDALCAPGHKGLLGVQGCGFCLLGERIHPDTLIEGGSGYQSLSPTMPTDFPERGEAGTLPTPLIASLHAGIGYLENLGLQTINTHHHALFTRLRDRLSDMPGYHIHLPSVSGSTLLFEKDGLSCDRIGGYLGEHGICVRTGYHCAPLAHKTLGTQDGGVRVSFGIFNTADDIDTLCRTLRRMDFCHEAEGNS